MEAWLAKIEKIFRLQPFFACVWFFGKREIDQNLMEFNVQIKNNLMECSDQTLKESLICTLFQCSDQDGQVSLLVLD